ncbi:MULTISPECIES: periplasmic heavy metal sensor [Asticcacaulis]|uniref:periplasmic heavy metal sensor n=1 Tax=Asticcacaulis TaxID=76890 RepID=UPI001AE2164C|nr:MULTISPECIES: periplasmic heavy metal sensor [Asticcacaulis]MBP2159010.1 Spy/CpxP family protein refolding chaperone [Asticcacaulis solisilvae]MDR6800055.1 Spy/CpxP family protein refolding chaperone [Asticcacaulis sp. BE141]
MSVTRAILFTLALSIVGAVLGAWGGAQYVLRTMHHNPPLHEIVHKKLNLTPAQQKQIEALEADHALKEHALEAEMRAANLQLAQAYKTDPTYTTNVQAAVDRCHMVMGEMQKETIRHVIAMRAVLTPEQAKAFDDTVIQALSDQAQ